MYTQQRICHTGLLTTCEPDQDGTPTAYEQNQEGTPSLSSSQAVRKPV